MSWDTVRLDRDDEVATLTVGRPDALNASNVATLEAMDEAIAAAAEPFHAPMIAAVDGYAFGDGCWMATRPVLRDVPIGSAGVREASVRQLFRNARPAGGDDGVRRRP